MPNNNLAAAVWIFCNKMRNAISWQALFLSFQVRMRRMKKLLLLEYEIRLSWQIFKWHGEVPLMKCNCIWHNMFPAHFLFGVHCYTKKKIEILEETSIFKSFDSSLPHNMAISVAVTIKIPPSSTLWTAASMKIEGDPYLGI